VLIAEESGGKGADFLGLREIVKRGKNNAARQKKNRYCRCRCIEDINDEDYPVKGGGGNHRISKNRREDWVVVCYVAGRASQSEVDGTRYSPRMTNLRKRRVVGETKGE